MGHRHSREEILEGALEEAFDHGLSQITFGRVAKRMGISDRVVVYYFPTKNDLVAEVLAAMGTRLQSTLADTFDNPVADHVELVRRTWSGLTDPAAEPVLRLFFEANGLAVTGREPYATLVPALVEAWIEWAAGLVEGSTSHRRREAETAIALADGLLLLRQLAGPDAAERAARNLGVV